jgi:DNA polymerase-1
MAKSLTGETLDLNDAVAHDCDLFLVDGNNLAYRGFYALPEELATADGVPTGALLGFSNMLFKLLVDYKPKGVAVAWDTKPVHRLEVSESYKSHRKPMPDLLREQFPHFRPLVAAFGYVNLEFEGWEADDVIATLATQADEQGIKTCVVSTDRDAFQLCSSNVCLMMTPRGVADVEVYTPEQVEARYGVPPERVPDFIGLKGDSSDLIPGVPGIGDKTAAELLGQFGSMEALLEDIDSVKGPKRRETLRENIEQARESKLLATMRRDLDLGTDPGSLVVGEPDRSALVETFRRFEFRNLLRRVDELDVAVPAADVGSATGYDVPWRLDSLPAVEGTAAVFVENGRCALALDDGSVVVSDAPEELDAALRSAERFVVQRGPSLPGSVWSSGLEPADDHEIAAYLIDPNRSGYEADDLAVEYGIDPQPAPASDDDDVTTLVRRAAATFALTAPLGKRLEAHGLDRLYREIELPLSGVLRAMEAAGVRVDTYRMGEITARLADRVEELEARAYELAGKDFVLGSAQQVAGILFETLGLEPQRRGKTGYSTDARVLRVLRDKHDIIPVIEEWREYSKLLNTYLGPLPALISEDDGRLHTHFNQATASTGRLSTSNPNLQSIPIRTELGRSIRSAFIAEPGKRLISADYSQVELRILAHVSSEEKLLEAFARGDDIHATTAAEVLSKPIESLTKDERNRAKAVNFGIIYGISAFGLSDQLGISREEAGDYIERYLARFPAVQSFIRHTVEEAEAAGEVRTLLGRRRPIPELRASNRQTRSLGERLAVNTVMQGSAADFIKVAMVAVQQRLRAEGRSTRLVLQVHDELLLEAPEGEVKAVKDMVREEMEGAFPLQPALAVDVGTGDDWAGAKD